MKDLKDSGARRIAHSCERGIHLCRCCALDVMTQGPTEATARQNLIEAVTLFQESCAELGSRDEIFREISVGLIESNLRTAAISHEQFLQLAV